jgi:radical SAM protein with 4Fe4S-binding SPASM domain
MASSKCDVVGHIEEDGSLVLNQRECAYIELDPTEVDECQSCVYLPLCMGGCAVDRSKTHEIDNTDLQLGRNCSTLKYNLVDMLKLCISLAPVTTSSL